MDAELKVYFLWYSEHDSYKTVDSWTQTIVN